MFSQFTQKARNLLNYFFIEKPASLNFLPNPRTTLMVSVFLLVCTSLLMIASASISFAISKDLPPLHFFYNQLVYAIFGVIIAWIVYKIPMKLYLNHKSIFIIWLIGFILLGITLFMPPVNGSRRWLNLGFVNFQVAEMLKVVMILMISDYVVRRSADVRISLLANWRLLITYLPIVAILIAQPDFGSFVMITASMLVVLFISGVSERQFAAVFTFAATVAAFFVAISSYRLSRLKSFQNPFDDPYDSGFQVINSLVALARGGLSGVGYGDSIQKLSYLPEAHTDFLFAITGEELGLIGSMFVLLLEFVIIGSLMAISYTALQRRQLRISYILFGFAAIIFGQTFINIGMNIGLTPAKGLTLPFFSYGGSSLLMSFVMLGFALQADKISAVVAKERRNADY